MTGNQGTQQGERDFFSEDGIRVTNARFVVGGQTFSMANVTSVTTRRTTPSRVLPVLLVIFGVSLLAASSWVGVAVLALGGWLFVRQRPTCTVVLGTAAGEQSALTSPDEARIARIVGALNAAIVARG